MAVDYAAICSPSRVEHICTARNIYCWMVRKYCGLSSNQVGRLINRNHATVLYAELRVKQWLDDPRIYPPGTYYAKKIEQRVNYYL